MRVLATICGLCPRPLGIHPQTLLLFLFMLAFSTPAWAHKMRVFAGVEGNVISGYAYFNGDNRAMHCQVTIKDAQGQVAFQGTTDDHGSFTFQPVRRSDYTITIDSGDGHVASTTIPADQLPDEAAAGDDLKTYLDRSIARQIRPLREQIEAYQDKIWWHDVIGGIGYIVGLCGLAFGWANRKRQQ